MGISSFKLKLNNFTMVHQESAHLMERGDRSTAMTPRHYLDFINEFVKLCEKKWADLKEQQFHLHSGLNILDATIKEVKEKKSAAELLPSTDDDGQELREEAKAEEEELERLSELVQRNPLNLNDLTLTHMPSPPAPIEKLVRAVTVLILNDTSAATEQWPALRSKWPEVTKKIGAFKLNSINVTEYTDAVILIRAKRWTNV